MISQSLYHELIRCAIDPDIIYSRSLSKERVKIIDELKRFIKPHVLVIHRPSSRGFYLDQQHCHIVDVSNCQEPQNPTKVAQNQLPGRGDLPAWVNQELSCTDDFCCYDSFWLY